MHGVDGTLGFSAASGDGARSLTRCLAIALNTPGRAVTLCPWNVHAASIDDTVPTSAPPSEEDMRAWLLESVKDALDWAWVEAGYVDETWLTGPETVQKRRRTRIWAAWMPLDDESAARPMFMAGRNWSDFQRLDPSASWRDRFCGGNPEHPWPAGAPLIVCPETSASLIRLLARFAHHPQARPGSRVGPGWVLSAHSRTTLLGSAVDDAGFAVEPRLLADGRLIVGTWGGPGGLRRASFRDPPESMPTSLVLEPPRVDPPKRAVWVTRADVHPTGDSWLIRLHGRRYPEGAGFQPCWRRVKPHVLLEACLGGVGAVHESHFGVVTPALVLDGLMLD